MLDSDEDTMGVDGGLDSSPASVTALSLPPVGITGAEILVLGALEGGGVLADVPPPSSINNSAHSHEMRYLELMV